LHGVLEHESKVLRLPQGVLSGTQALLQQGGISERLSTDHKIRSTLGKSPAEMTDIFKRLAAESLCQMWETCEDEVEDDNSSNADELRTITMSLDQLLRPDFKTIPMNTKHVEQNLDTAQRRLSSHMEEIQNYAGKITLLICRGYDTRSSRTVPLQAFFPPDFVLRGGYDGGSTIQVGRFMAPRFHWDHGLGDGRAPMWNDLISEVQFSSKIPGIDCPVGLTRTRSTLLIEMATSFCNLWQTNIYGAVRDAVIRYLVRIHIRRHKEARYYRSLVARSEALQNRQVSDGLEHQSKGMTVPQWARKKSSLVEQLWRAIKACDVSWIHDHLILKDKSYPTPASPRPIISSLDIGSDHLPVAPAVGPTVTNAVDPPVNT
ncbi:hypothetical protein BGZ83_004024, partial [Gryganskiella cystojenkinii]